MKYLVLGIGYAHAEYSMECKRWNSYGIEFHFVDNIQQAAQRLAATEYICVALCSDELLLDDLYLLRQIRPVPIVVVPPTYTAEQRYACVHYGATQYLHTVAFDSAKQLSGVESMRVYLDMPTQQRKPLTLITLKELCFCLECRSVKVQGREIELTAKEFDILALLIMNQRRVYTYEMITELIWNEECDFYSRKAINNHISNLRKKLKISPEIPDYIKSVHGIGYKFDTYR